MSWFISIRWAAALAALVFLALAWRVFAVRFPVEPVLLAIAVLILYNAVLYLTVWRWRQMGQLARDEVHVLAHTQVVCDLVLVALIWHFTGGVENAFGLFFIFPMVWASELLSRREAYIQAAVGAALVNAVVWGEYDGLLRHVHLSRFSSAGSLVDFVPSGLYQDWAFVFMVAFAISGALFVTVFLAATVAERLRLREEQLEAAYRGLQSVDAMKSHFMRKASHELRAPLAAIHVMLKTVLAGLTGQVDPQQQEMISRACRRTDSLTLLINDLLRYSRLEAEAGLDLPLRPTPLADVVRRTVELLAPSAAEKSLQVDSELVPATVLADEEGLTELVTNLVSNAIRYTPAGKRVTVTLATEDRDAVFAVADEGIGISTEDQTHLFEEFFRAETAKQAVQHGTGMGLAIVRRLVDSYHGSIDVKSQPGHGATFTVRLPLEIK